MTPSSSEPAGRLQRAWYATRAGTAIEPLHWPPCSYQSDWIYVPQAHWQAHRRLKSLADRRPVCAWLTVQMAAIHTASNVRSRATDHLILHLLAIAGTLAGPPWDTRPLKPAPPPVRPESTKSAHHAQMVTYFIPRHPHGGERRDPEDGDRDDLVEISGGDWHDRCNEVGAGYDQA